MQNFKENAVDLLFSIFYIILFPLQMLPSFMVAFVGTGSVWFWVACAVGLIALITQFFTFPCFGTRMWNSASIWALIVSLIYCNWWVSFGVV
jgi:hypothetical protein